MELETAEYTAQTGRIIKAAQNGPLLLSHSYLPNNVNNDVVNDGNLPVTILTHKAVSSGRLRIARTTMRIGLTNIVYSMRRFILLERVSATA